MIENHTRHPRCRHGRRTQPNCKSTDYLDFKPIIIIIIVSLIKVVNIIFTMKLDIWPLNHVDDVYMQRKLLYFKTITCQFKTTRRAT